MPTDHEVSFRMRELKALTGLRAWAALWVLLYHSSFNQILPNGLRTIVEAGYTAVSLFFILSGFILTYNYLPKGDSVRERDLGRYFVARVARIYPVYLVALALAAVVESPLLVESNPPLPSFMTNVITALGFQDWTIGGGEGWFNFPSWSVSCEIFFYLALPFMLLGFTRVPARFAWGLFLGLAASATVVAAIGTGMVVHNAALEAWFKFFPLLRTLEFATGAALGYAFSQERIPELFLRRSDIVVSASLVVAVAAILALSRWTVFLHSGGLAFPFAFGLIALAEERGFFVRALSTKSALLFGEASYSIYIFQVPIKILMLDLWILSHGGEAKPNWYKALTFFLMIGVGLGANRFIENPARRWIMAWHKRRKLAHA